MIDGSSLRRITVMIMEVPCCGGLLQLVLQARGRAQRQIPITRVVVGLRGEVLDTSEV